MLLNGVKVIHEIAPEKKRNGFYVKYVPKYYNTLVILGLVGVFRLINS
jgi:hypothetical protein